MEKVVAYQKELHKLEHEKDGKDNLVGQLRTERDKLVGDLSHVEGRLSEMTSIAEELREADSQMKKELQKARSVAKEASSAASELTDLRKQMTKKSKESQSAIDEVTSLSSQLTSLKQQMETVSVAHRSKEEYFERIQAENTRLVQNATSLAQEQELLKTQLYEQASTVSALKDEINAANKVQEKNATSLQQLRSGAEAIQKEKDQLTVQMSADRSRLDTLKNELDVRDVTHRKDLDALKELQRRIDLLHEEKQEFSANLRLSRANETKMTEAQAMYSSEKEGMQLELAKLKSSLEAKEEELQRALANAMEKSKTMSEYHSKESEDLKRQISKAEASLRAVEKLAEHKTRELEAHKKSTLEKYEKLVSEARRQGNIPELLSHEQRSNDMLVRDPRPRMPGSMQADGSQTPHSHPIKELVARNEDSFDSTVTKARKKPIRLNTTVVNVAEFSKSQPKHLLRSSNAIDDRLEGQDEDYCQRSLIDAHYTDESGTCGTLDEHGASLMERAVEESQEPPHSLAFSVVAFDDNMRAVNNYRKAESTSSALSEPLSSDDLIDMDPLEQGTLRVNPENDYKRFGAVRNNRRNYKTPQSLSRNSLHEASALSQDRPKSQANTGSRMLAPTTPTGSFTGDHRPLANIAKGFPSRGIQTGRARSGNTRSSSPDYIHRPMSSLKTYGNHSSTSADHVSGAPFDTPRSNPNGATVKRKGPGGHVPENESSKRHRSSIQLGSSQSTSSSHPAQTSQGQSQGPFVVRTPRNRRSKGMTSLFILEPN